MWLTGRGERALCPFNNGWGAAGSADRSDLSVHLGQKGEFGPNGRPVEWVERDRLI